MSKSQQQPPTNAGSPPERAHRGIVKIVLSGDSMVIRGQPRNGPPPEKTLVLSNIMAPKVARRGKDGENTRSEEPYAWEAREFLRKTLIGKEVNFSIEFSPSSSSHVYGSVWVTVNGQPQNVTDLLLSEGWAGVKQTGKQNEEIERITLLEASAKSASKGQWKKEGNKAIREVVGNMNSDELRTFVERNHNKEFDAVIEHVRDGATVRVVLLPSFTIFMFALSGVKCPMFKREGDKENPEKYAEQARFFTECRLLQRDVKVSLEGVSNQLVYGSIKHPAGNISELLLKEGFARCVDWSMAFVSNPKDRERLRNTEKQAKKEQLHLWKGFTPSSIPAISSKAKHFTAKVTEVGNGDNMVVKTGDGSLQKIFLSSLRSPKQQQQQQQRDEDSAPSQTRLRPLFDIPCMFEAREFMRKKLIGKKVSVTLDYIKPAQDTFPQKTCCTVNRDNVNIAEALISKGLGSCLRHRQDDDQRSGCYDDLLAAEARAIKNAKGIHRKELSVHRVADFSLDSSKAKAFLPFLQRAGRTVALVEFVASGSRLRLYLLKDSCLINFILAGVSCPRAPNARDGREGEPSGQEALTFTKELVMQREVEIEVEQSDKGGNFIGWLYYEGRNLSVSLVTDGLSKVLPQAERSVHARELFDCEENARVARKGVWKDYVEPAPVEEEPEDSEAQTTPTSTSDDTPPAPPPERKTNFQKVVVTEMVSCVTFYAQQVEQGPKLDQLMEQLRSDLSSSPPLIGSYKPTKGTQCIAKFSDGLWYRVKVEKMAEGNKCQVLYMDFGNKSVVPISDTAKTPAGFSDMPPFAKEYSLSCCLPPNQDFVQDAEQFFMQEVLNKAVFINVEYKHTGQEFVTLQLSLEEEEDVGSRMLSEGLLRTERRREKKLAKLVSDNLKAEEEARKNRAGMWCYGDATPDEAREFGYQK